MSGKPYPEGVKRAVQLIDEIEELRRTINHLEPLVAELHTAHEKFAQASKALQKLLADMDLESKGNYGFEARMGWFLFEMRRQMIEADERVDRSEHVIGCKCRACEAVI